MVPDHAGRNISIFFYRLLSELIETSTWAIAKLANKLSGLKSDRGERGRKR